MGYANPSNHTFPWSFHMNKLATLILLLSCSVFSELLNKNYTFFITKELPNSIIIDQYSPIPDSEYFSINTLQKFHFKFSNNFDTLTVYNIMSFEDFDTLVSVYNPDLADLFQENSVNKNYDIISGLFAGGVIHILDQSNPIKVDFRIFGSGVPIINSKVGILESETSTIIKPNSKKSIKRGNHNSMNNFLLNGRSINNFKRKSFIGKKKNNDLIIIHKD